MTVPEEVWVAVGAEQGLSLNQVRARIAEIDDGRSANLERDLDLPHSHFDRDLDPITLGEWSLLYSSICYRFIRQTILPNRFWIATIWTGTTDDPFTDDPPLVMETAVFKLIDPDRERLPEHSYREVHRDLDEALAAHPRIANWYSG